jgi:prepilin-type N-terminal cleavage/methylation domain-containing protein
MKKNIKGMTLVEVVIAMVILVTLLVGIAPMFIAMMRANTRDRWETFAVAQTRELIETIKRIASTSTGYINGDTNGNTIIDNPAGYQEIALTDGNHSDPNNPISFVSGAKTMRVNRYYKVVTTTIGTSSYKTITVWIEPSGTESILKKVTLETVISSP